MCQLLQGIQNNSTMFVILPSVLFDFFNQYVKYCWTSSIIKFSTASFSKCALLHTVRPVQSKAVTSQAGSSSGGAAAWPVAYQMLHVCTHINVSVVYNLTHLSDM